MISAFSIINNEQELVGYMLDSFARIVDLLDVLSIVDNDSSDDTLDIIHSYKDKLPIVVQRYSGLLEANHGVMRNLAMSKCRGDWILYLDADETIDTKFCEWLRTDIKEQADIWDIYKYSTIVDAYHYTDGGGGLSTRLFRNRDGVNFPQAIHTHPEGNLSTKRAISQSDALMFDATATKCHESLYAKGWRYRWAMGREAGIGNEEEYTGRVANAHRLGIIREFDDATKARIFTGKGVR